MYQNPKWVSFLYIWQKLLIFIECIGDAYKMVWAENNSVIDVTRRIKLNVNNEHLGNENLLKIYLKKFQINIFFHSH